MTLNSCPDLTPIRAWEARQRQHDVPVSKQIDELERTVEPTWSGLVEPLERLTDRLGVAWGTVSHLKAVRDSKELREAVEVSSGSVKPYNNYSLRRMFICLCREDCGCSC